MTYRNPINVRLGDVLNLKRGHDLTRSEMIFGPFKVIGSSGVIGHHNSYRGLKPCITVGRSGTVGKVQIHKEFCWPHNTTLYVDDFKGNNPFYLYYLLKNYDLANH